MYLRPSLSSLDVRANTYSLFCSALALISHNQHTIVFVGTPTAQLTQPALFRFLNSQAVTSSPTHTCAPHHPRMRLQRLLLALPQFAEERSSQGHRTLFDQEFLSMAAFSTAHPVFRPRFRGLPPHHHMYDVSQSIFNVVPLLPVAAWIIPRSSQNPLSFAALRGFQSPPPAPSQSATQMPSLTNASGNLLPAAAVLHFTGSPKPWNVYVPPTADHFDDSDAEAWSLVQGAAVGGHWAMNVVSWGFRFVLVRGSKRATKTLHYA